MATSREVIATAQTTCDEARLTRTRSREMRRRRSGPRCPVCRCPITPEQPGYGLAWFGAEGNIPRETECLHERCLAVWLAMRIRTFAPSVTPPTGSLGVVSARAAR